MNAKQEPKDLKAEETAQAYKRYYLISAKGADAESLRIDLERFILEQKKLQGFGSVDTEGCGVLAENLYDSGAFKVVSARDDRVKKGRLFKKGTLVVHLALEGTCEDFSYAEQFFSMHGHEVYRARNSSSAEIEEIFSFFEREKKQKAERKMQKKQARARWWQNFKAEIGDSWYNAKYYLSENVETLIGVVALGGMIGLLSLTIYSGVQQTREKVKSELESIVNVESVGQFRPAYMVHIERKDVNKDGLADYIMKADPVKGARSYILVGNTHGGYTLMEKVSTNSVQVAK